MEYRSEQSSQKKYEQLVSPLKVFNIFSHQGNENSSERPTSTAGVWTSVSQSAVFRLSLSTQPISAGMQERGTHIQCWWEYKIVQPLWESHLSHCIKKLNIEIPHKPAVSILGMQPKDAMFSYRDTSTSMSIDALFSIPRKSSIPGCPSSDK